MWEGVRMVYYDIDCYSECYRSYIDTRFFFIEDTVWISRYFISDWLIACIRAWSDVDGSIICIHCDFRGAFSGMAHFIFVAWFSYFIFTDEDS